MNDWFIHFDTNLNINILVIILSIFILIYISIFLIYRKYGKISFALSILRLLPLLLILLFIFNPVLVFNYDIEMTKDVPIIVDTSFSMKDSIVTKDKSISKLDYIKGLISEQVINTEDMNSIMNPILYDPIDKVMIDDINSLSSNGILDMDVISKLVKDNQSYSKLIMVSDLKISDEDFDLLLNRITNIPIFIINPIMMDNDISIKELSFDKIKNTINVIAKTKENKGKELISKLILDNKTLISKNITINQDITQIEMPIPDNLYGNFVFTLEIDIDGTYDNELDNTDYIEIDLEKKEIIPIVHYLFDKPTFNTAFISRIIKNSEDMKLKQYYPNYDNQINTNIRINNNDIIILQDLDNEYISLLPENIINKLKKHINNDGKTLLLYSNQDPFLIQKRLFPDMNLIQSSSKTNTSFTKEEFPMILTQQGKKSDFLNFDNRSRSQEYWNTLNFFYPPTYNIQQGKDGLVLSTIDNKPGIITSEKKDITIFNFSGLWKMDFKNLTYGLKTHYLPDMLTDLLVDKKPFFEKNSRIIIKERILEFGERTQIFFNPNFVNPDEISIVNMNEQYKIYPMQMDRVLKADFIAKSIGKHEIYHKGELLGSIYVRYPEKETLPINIEKAKEIAHKTDGSVITNDFENLSKYFEKDTIKINKKERINLYNPYIFFILILVFLSLDWIIRKRNLI